ncbi:patatin-like phospholipase family protein [Sphingopyxis sp.]|uniref:patatin-like phospholipase family protein n=1 Tax=Sphingopyxis sp. TaxID=1908224 RepID=UPI002FCAC939
MKRLMVISAMPLLLGGCIHLDAKPFDFTCGQLLDAYSETYQATPLFAELQRDGGLDECTADPDGKPRCTDAKPHALDGAAFPMSDPIIAALAERRRSPTSLVAPDEPAKVLMLSGGGSWGAFGAGYLEALGRNDWTVVTGVSTGALQALFVAAGDYAALAKAYDIADETDLARSNGLRGFLSKGSQYSIAPLRTKVLAYLLPTDGSESPLIRMIEPGRPQLSIAMVEARSGDLKAVHITRMLRVELGGSTPDRAKLERVGQCVAGVALASSSIPVRLTPIRIDKHSYVDGGVRSSVFDSGIARRVGSYAASLAAGKAPHIYVVRNGPTIVFHDAFDKKDPETAAVDARPDILRVGMRGYSTIVNQNELMSIAALRLNYLKGDISVISADGFNAPPDAPASQPRQPGPDTPARPTPCGPRPEALFHAGFMRCLIGWGAWKAKYGPDWIALSGAAAPAPAPAITRR